MATFDIDTTDRSIVDTLQEDVPDGVSVKLKVRFLESAGGGGGIEGVVIEVLNHPVTQAFILVLSRWLYTQLAKKGIKKVTINRTEIELTEGNITKIVTENVEIRN
jgi:hypothetical protein